jgi:hypothetical protein
LVGVFPCEFCVFCPFLSSCGGYHVHMDLAWSIHATYHFQRLWIICFRECASLIHIDRCDMLDVSLWSSLWALVMYGYALGSFEVYMHVKWLVLEKMLSWTSLVSRIFYMLILCSNGYILLNLCLGIILFSFGGQRPICHHECLAYMLPCGGA